MATTHIEVGQPAKRVLQLCRELFKGIEWHKTKRRRTMARIEKREGWKVWLKDELIPIDVKTVQQAHEIEVAMKKIQDGELKDL